MPQDPKARYVLVYDGEHGVRMAPAGTRSTGPVPLQPGWDPWDLENAGEITLETEDEAAVAPRRGRHVLAGVAGLCVLGLALGLTLRTPLADKPPARPAAPPTTSAPAPHAIAARPAPVERTVAKVAQAAPVAAPLKPAAAPHHAAAPAAPKRLAQAAPHRTAARPAPKHLAEAAPAPRAAPPHRDRADCGQTRTDSMVCGDAGLAAADRRLGQALQAAVQAGAPIDQLRAQQDDWRARREIASHMSRDAVARAYEQRIRELKAMTANDPPY